MLFRSQGSVPADGKDVIIRPTSNQPVLSGATANLASLKIETGASLNAGGNTVNVSGDLTVDGTLTSTGMVNLNGTGTQVLTAGGTSFTNLQVSGGNGTVTVSGNLTVIGTLTISAGDTIKVGSVAGTALAVGTLVNDGTLMLRGNETGAGVTVMDTDSGSVWYYGNTSTTGFKLGNTYFNLRSENMVDSGALTRTLNAALEIGRASCRERV